MDLTSDEYNILATRHANGYEASQLRDRLMAEGLHFCSVCKTIKEADEFRQSDKGRGGRESMCRRCRTKRRGRRSGYIPTGPRYEENEARSRERDPDAWREAKRKAGRRHTARKRAANPPVAKPTLSPSELRSNSRASKRRNFQKRKALGMSGRQANYMAPAAEFDESWNAIKR